MSLFVFRLLFALIIVVLLVGIASADYHAGRSLKPYQNNDKYKAGRSLKPYYQPNYDEYDYRTRHSPNPYYYQPNDEEYDDDDEYDYRAGRSLKPYYQPYDHEYYYRAGRSLKPYPHYNKGYKANHRPYQPNYKSYRAGRSLKPYYQPYDDEHDAYRAGRSLKPYYQPYDDEHDAYRAGRSRKPYYQPYDDEHDAYRAGRSRKPYPKKYNNGYKAGLSLKPYKPHNKSYKPQDKSYNPKDEKYIPTPKSYKNQDNTGAIKIQGLIYCNKNSQKTKMQGATAKVTCEVKDKNGYDAAPFSVETQPTDANGYFLINLGKYTVKPGYTFTNCKVFLDEAAPGDYCNRPTNTGDGISGAIPSKPRRLSDNSMLYSVGPFVFIPSSY